MRISTMTAIALALIVAGAPHAASAAPDASSARPLFKRGQRAFKAERYRRAAALYKRAYAHDPKPAFLFNVAQSYRKAGDCALARTYFRHFVRRVGPTGRGRGVVKNLIADCTDRPAAARSMRRRARPGLGRVPASRTLRKRRRVPSPAAPSLVNDATRAPALHVEASPAPERSRMRPALLWTGVGVSAALLTAAAVTGGLAVANHGEYNDPATSVARRRELVGPGEALGAATTVTLVLGATTAAATALYFWLGGASSPATDHTPAVALTPLRGGGGAALVQGRF